MRRREVFTDGSSTVEVQADESDQVRLRLQNGHETVTLIGSRFDVHQLVIEADRQLGRLAYPSSA